MAPDPTKRSPDSLLMKSSSTLSNESCTGTEQQVKETARPTVTRQKWSNEAPETQGASGSNGHFCSSFMVGTISLEEVEFGKKLGSGEFCDVYEITLKSQVRALKRLRSSSQHMGMQQPMNPVQRQLLQRQESERSAAAVDLTEEAKLLASLKHEHIVEVFGLGKCIPITDSLLPEQHCGEDFYFVMERLEKTLMQQVEDWKRQKKQEHKLLWKERCTKSHFRERLQVGLQLAKAIKYLHSQNVVHRDLKAENVGFDANGTLKLFDFGLAHQLQNSERSKSSAGTICYMAPELLQRQRRGVVEKSCDVYSFGLLLWELLSLETAFEGFTPQRYQRRVVQRGERPKLSWLWPRRLRVLMQQCWASEPNERPSMDHVVEELQEGLKRAG